MEPLVASNCATALLSWTNVMQKTHHPKTLRIETLRARKEAVQSLVLGNGAQRYQSKKSSDERRMFIVARESKQENSWHARVVGTKQVGCKHGT